MLDDIAAIKSLDQSNVLGSVDALPDQCLHAWEEASQIKVPENYQDFKAVVMTGMGGSGLGARMIESAFAGNLKIPYVRVNDYELPKWADENTLVICSSFSGTTEETIENAKLAQAKGCKWMAISTGETLNDYAVSCGVPYYKINPVHNPSKQPRMANGYSVIGQLILVAKTGLIDFDKTAVDHLVSAMKKIQAENNVNQPTADNPAKKMAQAIFEKNLVYVSARHMTGAAHSVKNQANENSKTFSTLFEIPELNHHLMEGLKHPSSNKQDLVLIFIESDLYPDRISQRMEITKDVVSQNEVSVVSWKAQAPEILSQGFEFLQFAGYVNLYLSILYHQDPAPIPWVDYFKTKLGQSLGQWK